MGRKLRVGLVGGGLGGLTAALALNRQGFEVHVFEQANKLRELGAGIGLSPNPLKVLRALVWLGGEHWDLKGGDNTQYENADDVQLVHQVRADPKVVERLTALAKREDAWLQDAAVLALSPEDTHFGP